jgi:hypothetical protein
MFSTKHLPQYIVESGVIEKVLHTNWIYERIKVAILVSDKIDWKSRLWEKESQYKMINKSIHQYDIAIINIWHLIWGYIDKLRKYE